MAAARYWRLVSFIANARGALELTEAHLFDSTGRVDASATLACTMTPSQGSVANLRDADTHTSAIWDASTVRQPGFALVWDFGSSPANVLWAVFGAADVPGRFVSECTLQNSDDGANWITVRRLGGYVYPGPWAMVPVSSGGGADPGLAVWYDASVASSISETAGVVSQWSDVSGNGRHWYQSNAASAPVLRKNRLLMSAVDLTGGKFMSLAAPYIGNKKFSVFIVLDRTVAASAYHSLGVLRANGGNATFGSGSVPFFAGFFGSLPDPGSSLLWAGPRSSYRRGTASSEPAGALTVVTDGSGVAALAITYQSVDQRPYTPPSNFDDPISIDRLGGDSEGLYVSGGAIAELAIWDRQLSGAECNWLQVYAESKWGVPVSGVAASDESPMGGGGLEFGPFSTGYGATRAQCAASAAIDSFGAPAPAGVQLARDIEFGGAGTVYGTTKTKGTPNLPTKARVVLQHQRSKLPVRETWSDPVTGAFVFTDIDTSQQFLALAEDAEGHFRPVAANRLTPEVL